MAITKIRAVKSHLEACLNYTADPVKTQRGLEGVLGYAQAEHKTLRLYVAAGHCAPDTALETMLATRRRWGRDGPRHVQGYQIIQSFAPGEVTPEQCFAIGCEFARRYLADRYEYVVCAHLDREHLHCHIVLNAVSFLDGTMFRNDFAAYYRGIRAVSDELCRAEGLSGIDTDGKGCSYAHWQAQQQGRPTLRSLIRQDVAAAAAESHSRSELFAALRRKGYTVHPSGPGRRYTTLQAPFAKRAVRMDTLGPGYTEAEMHAFFAGQAPPPEPTFCTAAMPHPPLPRTSRMRGYHTQPRRRIRGFMAVYYRWCRLLKQTGQGHASRRSTALLWEDLRKFERYREECSFLWQHRIESDAALAAHRAQAEADLARLSARRQKLYRRCPRTPEIRRQIYVLTGQMRLLRREVRLCTDIEADAARLARTLADTRTDPHTEKELDVYEPRSRCR